jgi:hypothetical protein
MVPGSAGCQPALFGSLPKSFSFILLIVGKLPTTAGLRSPDHSQSR